MDDDNKPSVETNFNHTPLEIEQYSEAEKLTGFCSFKDTEVLGALQILPHTTIGIFSGNQGGKTSSVAEHYVIRLFDSHKVKRKNELMRKVRCMSSSLPEDSSAEEQDNTQYLELKKRIPYELIEKDITARAKNLVVKRPFNLGKTIFEFRSSKQEIQDLGKIQISSLWHDEETPKPHREECKMRLLKENGDEIFTLTPINALCFDEDTEILTKRGWKRYDTILASDYILTYNIKEDHMEWKYMNRFFLDWYRGKMICFKNNSFDFCVTPEHKWVVCNDRRKNEFYLEKSNLLNTRHIIKRIAKRASSYPDNPCFEDEFISLAGWLVSDGSCGRNLVIYQSLTAYPQNCEKLDAISNKYCDQIRIQDNKYGGTFIDGKYWDGSGIMRRYRIIGDLRKRLKEILDEKSLKEDFICTLSDRQLQILFDAIVDGDGYRNESGGIRLNQRGNEKLIDNFQLISTLLGKLSHKSKWTDNRGKLIDGIHVYANSERYWPNTHVKNLDIKEYDYEGFIWCPSTENGTVVVRRNGCVSISGNTYTYDEIWQNACLIYRTKTIVDKFNLPRVEVKDTGFDIACIQMATDDNPELSPQAVDRLMEEHSDDPASYALRRYGIFKAVTGRIHKTYNPAVGYIDYRKYFPNGIPYSWFHARGIDYHESRIPWSVLWMSASPTNEWFYWQEFHPAIDGPNAYSTYDIAKAIVRKSGDFYYQLNLIDPLANKKQPNTLMSTTDDLNRHFDDFRNMEGLGTPAYWQGWDTKGTKGRDIVAMRFKNASRCGVPFNNTIREHGKTRYIPTLWICDTCPRTHRSILNWRYGEYVTAATKAVNDPKNQPQQKNSHDNMVMECLAKSEVLQYAYHYLKPMQSQNQNYSLTGRPIHA